MDQTQVEALEQKHAHLEALIDEEEHRPHPDDIRLHELKKAKLRVKDEMVGHEGAGLFHLCQGGPRPAPVS